MYPYPRAYGAGTALPYEILQEDYLILLNPLLVCLLLSDFELLAGQVARQSGLAYLISS